MGKTILLVLFLLSYLFFISPVSAQVKISIFNAHNEGSSNDFIILINNADSAQNLENYDVYDRSGKIKDLPACFLQPQNSYLVACSNRLNNDGDQINLRINDQIIDCVSYNSGPSCSGGSIDLPALSSGQYALRQNNNWSITNTINKPDNNLTCLQPTPTPTQTPTLTPTCTPTPTPQAQRDPALLETATTPPEPAKGYYQININDNVSNVRIYVDDQYTHHYAPELLTFCDTCFCDADKQISCKPGKHLFHLERSGYDDNEWEKTINVGDSFTDNITLNILEPEPTPTPTVTPTPQAQRDPAPQDTPTPQAQPDPALQDIASNSGLILGENIQNTTNPPTLTTTQPKSKPTIVLFLIGGFLILSSTAYFVWSKIKT